MECGEGFVHPRFGETGFTNARNELFGQKFFGEESEELFRGFKSVEDELAFLRTAVFDHQAAFGARIVEVFEHPIRAVGTEMQAAVFGGDGGHGMRFVEHQEIVRPKHAATATIFAGAGSDVREEQGVVDDDDVGIGDTGPSFLVEAGGMVTVFAGARGGVRVDPFPDFGSGRGSELVAQAMLAGGGPLGDALQFRVLAGGNQFLFVAQGVGETGGAEVVAFAHEDRGTKVGVTADGVVAGEHLATERKVLAIELLLERDGVGGDNQLAVLVDGLDDAGQ